MSFPYSAADEKTFLRCIPNQFQEAILDNCPDLPPKIVEFGREWAKTFPLKSLFIHGDWGSGKTWFSFALSREIMRNKPKDLYFWPRYTTAKELDCQLLKAARHPDGDAEAIRMWADQDLLFIDEIDKINRDENGNIGNRFKYQFVELINRRLQSNKSTILTSNYAPLELGQIIDGSLISRMGDQTKWKVIRFPAKDLRKSKVIDFST